MNRKSYLTPAPTPPEMPPNRDACPSCGKPKAKTARHCIECWRRIKSIKSNGKKPKIKTNKGNGRAVVVRSGLWTRPEEWAGDKRHPLYGFLKKGKKQLAALFPKTPDGAAQLLIDRIVFKSLKLSMFEALEMAATAAATPSSLTPQVENQGTTTLGHEFFVGSFQKYIQLSNSIREDIRLLHRLANTHPPEPSDPDLTEYLATLRKAAKATPVNVVHTERSGSREQESQG